MRIYKTTNYDDMSRKAANIIAAQIITKPDCVLGLATGSTPIGAYKELVDSYQKGDLDFSSVSSVNLDEYKGLSRDSDQSYYYFMNEHLFKHVNINTDNTNLPDGTVEDSTKACEDYNAVIHSMGGVDLQLLGLGHNGHIGFNEPADEFPKETHCVALAESTINANARLFADPNDVPRYAYTMGIQTIMQAKKILLLVSGEEKSDILYQVVCGPVTPNVPASILQFHDNVTLVADEAALKKLIQEGVVQ